MNWMGFSAKRDKTMLPPNWLVEPSQNCLVPDGDKVIPREGSQLVFQGPDDPLFDGSIGGYTKFKNFFGIEMDVKAYRDATEGEQVLVLFNDVYVPITINPNTSLNGTGRIYFSTYTDASLDLSQNKRLPRICWVNGYEHTDGTGRVFSWTGGISAIATIVGNIITLPVGQTWRKLGFTEYFFNGALTGEIHVTINGVDFFSNNLAELDTDTLTLDAPPTAVAGDTVTSTVEVDELVAPMDNLLQNKNYMYYGNEMYRQWWMSNQFGRPNNVVQIGSNSELDDMNVVSLPSSYTGTNKNTYRIQIVATDPAVPAVREEEQNFFGTGTPIFFDTSGYTPTNETNKYVLKCIFTRIFTCGTYVGTITPGEPIRGATSGAYGILNDDPQAALNETSVHTISEANFQVGEVITGQFSGATFIPTAIRGASSVAFFKNDNQIPLSIFHAGNGILDDNGVPRATPLTLVDGLAFIPNVQNPSYISLDYGDYVELTITTVPAHAGSPDEFGVSKNGNTIVGSVAITGAPQTTAELDGISIQFSSTTGHAVGDWWEISANRGVFRPWADFYYTLDFNTQQSARRPGEGYIYDIPSNFHAMGTFEESIYLNTSNGEWGYTTPTLSADLKSEDISFTPLKQVGSSKVLYPYLIGHNRNDLVYIDENKNLVSLGRKLMLERVQSSDMSDVVLSKFQELSFLNGSIKFQDDSLYITSPEENTMMVYLERKEYWQPPQFIPNLGILTIIGTQLYTHSTLDTGTRRLNDPTAEGDDGVEYEVVIRNGTYDHGNRWIKKASNMGFWEGYVWEAPPMKMKAYFDPDGCAGIKSTDIDPIPCCEATNQGNFGGGNDGDHEFGGAQTVRSRYARFQWDKLGSVDFYFSSLEFRCRTKKHTYEVLSMGLNLAESKFNNKDYRPDLNALMPI